MHKWSPQIIQEQLSSLADTTQIIIVHPQYQYQNRVTHYLTQQDKTSYLRFEGNNLTVAELHEQVDDYLVSQSGDSIKLLILDECDRVESSVLKTFLVQFIKDNKNTRVAIVSRTVPNHLLESKDFRTRCQFIPVADQLMLYDYAQRETDTTLVEVRAFGSGRVYVNGQPIDQWDGILPRRLFFYLADRGMATRNDIFATFWPQLQKKEATNVFHVTKRKITDVIGKPFTKFSDGFYRIAPNILLYYDVVQFTNFIQSGIIADNDEGIQLLESAISLYRAPFLNAVSGENVHWIEKRREEIHEMYGEALSILANSKLEAGQEEEAVGTYLKALKVLKYREEIVEKVMHIYQQWGQPIDALQLYEWIKGNLKEDFDMEPGAPLQNLASTIQANLQLI